MWIRSIGLREAPGVDELELGELGPGVNVILGPNASGKSTLARALRSLFAAPAAGREGWVRATLEHDGQRLELKRAPGAAASVTGGEAPPASTTEPELYELDLARLATFSEEGAAGDRLAAGFARELFGGVDLEAARRQYPVRSPGGRSSILDRRDTARNELEQILSKARALGAEESRLTSLRKQRDAARRAHDDGALARRLVELLELRETLSRTREERARLDPALEAVGADALSTLEGLESELAGAEREVETRRRQRAELQRETEQLAFPGAAAADPREALDQARAKRELCRELGDAQRALEKARAQLAEAHAAEAEAGRAFFERPPEAAAPASAPRPGAGDEPALTEADAAELDRALADLAEARTLRRSAEAWASRASGKLSKLQERARELGLPDDPERLREGLGALHRWLSVTPERHQGLFGLFGVGLFLAGAGVGIIAHALVFWHFRLPHLAAALMGAVGLGLAGWAWSRRLRRDGGGPERTLRQADAERAGVIPRTWTRDAVGERVAEGWEILAHTEAVDGLLSGPDAIVSQSGDALEQARARALELGERFGLSPELPTLTAQERAHRLVGLIRAQESAERAAASQAQAEERVASHRGELTAFLEGLGLEASGPPAELQTLTDQVVDRLGELVKLEAELGRADADLERAVAARRVREQHLAEAFAGWGLPPGERRRLAELAGDRPALDATESRLKELVREEARLLADLEEGVVRDRLGLERDAALLPAVHDLVASLAERGDTWEELDRQIHRIEAEIDVTGRADTLGRARAERDESLRALALERDRQLHHHLVRACLDDALTTFESDHQPERLRRASELFSGFTRHQWRLEMDPSGGGSFLAEDLALRQRRRLDQLSEGTRIHLLLAARLAAIEAHEGPGPRLPLCLDELLSTTDPARFEEIAGLLFDLAAAGRQIFYFSSTEAEAAQWQAAAAKRGLDAERLRIHHLEAGRLAGDFGGATSLRPAEARPVPPPPADADPDAYARSLGVPPVDGHREASAWHLIHLLADDLEAVHLLLRRGARTLGHWRAARDAAGGGPLAAKPAALLDLRGALLEQTLSAWRLGRGRPLTWADIEASGAVSATFVDRVRDLLERSEGDGERFVASLDADLKGFRRSRREELIAHLEGCGVLGDGALLDEAEILARALAGASEPLEVSGVSPDAARAFVGHLLSLLSTEQRAAPEPVSLKLVEGGSDG